MREPVVALMAGLALVAATDTATSEPAQPYTPGLVEFMMNVQSHHAKLWLAGNARNWDLADYQVDELKELLEDIAKRVPEYKGTPVGKMVDSTTMPPIGDVEKCHQGARLGEVHGGIRQAHSGLQCNIEIDLINAELLFVGRLAVMIA